jgi:hypothetical protein
MLVAPVRRKMLIARLPAINTRAMPARYPPNTGVSPTRNPFIATLPTP